MLNFPKDQGTVDGGNGGSAKLDDRLRNVEGDVREIKADMRYVAKREDISSLKIWILGGVISALLLVFWLGVRLLGILASGNAPTG